jgi:hypothetical protein
MVLQSKPERQLIEEALAAGHLTIPDEHGFHHGMYAVCPKDQSHAAPQRPVWKRDVRGRYIDHIVFHCDNCSHTWEAKIEEIHLY